MSIRRVFRKCNPTNPAVSWTSKYGAVYAVGYDGGVTEGMNEKGLVVNGLFCKGTVYNNSETEKKASHVACHVRGLATRHECHHG